jgi:hypothetical protein
MCAIALALLIPLAIGKKLMESHVFSTAHGTDSKPDITDCQYEVAYTGLPKI